MDVRSKLVLFLSVVFIIFACESESTKTIGLSKKSANEKAQLFQMINADESNIHFRNTLEEGLNTNILMYEYFYNGGGVAIADFNQDGIEDIYFTSNMGDNKLYLNSSNPNDSKIDLEYKDVTQEARASGRKGPWKTGVNAIDINYDGKMDLYLCYSGALPIPKRQNQLLVNLGNNKNGVPVFQDQAARYGLDSPAFSNQSYFLDFDNDGDLDMLLLNHNPKNLPMLNEAKTRAVFETQDQFKGLRLFENTGIGFKDVTAEKGVHGSELSYGLGLAISDLNNDGWPDFYVSNDYNIPDYLYMNNSGIFENKLTSSMGHTSQFSMGNDIADINGDGLMDIVTLDMLPEDNYRQKLLLAPDNYSKYDLNLRSGFYHQNMRNMLQLNNGNGTFSEIGQVAGISNTDWSWSALLADYNQDGYQDLYVTNGYNKDYTNLDFINFMDDFVAKKGRLMRENVLEIIENMPSSDVANYAFKGGEGIVFSDATTSWGLDEVANSNGAAYADLDNDGDLDLVVNNVNRKAFLYENKAEGNYLQVKLKGPVQNVGGIGAKVTVFVEDLVLVKEQFPARGYLSSVSYVFNFGLGQFNNVDSILVRWPDSHQQKLTNQKANQVVTLEYSKSSIFNALPAELRPIFSPTKPIMEYSHRTAPFRDFDRQALMLRELSHEGPVLKKADINGDGKEELFVDGQFSNGKSVQYKGYLQDAAFFDADGDGDLDVYLAIGGYHDLEAEDQRLKDQFFINDGKGNFSDAGVNISSANQHSSSVVSIDLNGDGFKDLFVGSLFVPGRFPESRSARFLINDGSGKFEDKSSEFPEILRVTDAIEVREQLYITTALGPVYQLSSDKSLSEIGGHGWWSSISAGDFNQDGEPDFIIGNLGDNTQLKVSEESPLGIFAKDFDGNGSIDPLLTYTNNEESVPLMTKDELAIQLVLFKSIYADYESFANSNTSDVLEKLDQEGMKTLTMKTTKSILLLSDKKGGYEVIELPLEAQYSSVHSITVLDYDNDGKQDLLLCGNDEKMKLQLGKMDANYGQLFKGNGDGEFTYIPQTESGLAIRGDVRSVVKMGKTLYFGINGKPLIAKTYAK